MEKEIFVSTLKNTIEKYEHKNKSKVNLLIYLGEKKVYVRILDEYSLYVKGKNGEIDIPLKEAIGRAKYNLALLAGYEINRIMYEKLIGIKKDNNMNDIVAIFNRDIIGQDKFYVQDEKQEVKEKRVKIININEII